VSTFLAFLNDNLFFIGLIFISPMLCYLFKGLTLWLAANVFKVKKDITIRHYHNGSLIKEVVIQADLNEALIVRNIVNKKEKINP